MFRINRSRPDSCIHSINIYNFIYFVLYFFSYFILTLVSHFQNQISHSFSFLCFEWFFLKKIYQTRFLLWTKKICKSKSINRTSISTMSHLVTIICLSVRKCPSAAFPFTQYSSILFINILYIFMFFHLFRVLDHLFNICSPVSWIMFTYLFVSRQMHQNRGVGEKKWGRKRDTDTG